MELVETTNPGARTALMSARARRLVKPKKPPDRAGVLIFAARYWLNMSPLMTLGGLAGAQTCTPGLNALREASGSNIGSLAYTVPYAIGNIVLTIWGPVVVAIVHAMRT